MTEYILKNDLISDINDLKSVVSLINTKTIENDNFYNEEIDYLIEQLNNNIENILKKYA